MKHIFFLLSFLLIPWIMVGQRTKELHLTFSPNDFNYETYEGYLYIHTTKYDYGYKSDIGEPSLPYIIVNLLVGADEEFSDFEIDYIDEEVLNGITVAPIMGMTHTSNDTHRGIVSKPNYVFTAYPTNTVEYCGTRSFGGYKYVSFLVCPFKYNNNEKKLSLAREVKINSILTKDNYGSSNRNGYNSTINYGMKSMVYNMVVNGNELDSLYGDIIPKEMSQKNN